MAVAFPYETAPRSAGVTADAPDVTDDMITAGTGAVPEGQTADEAFGKITEGRTYSQELGEGFKRGRDQTSSMVAMGLETIATAIGADGVANFARERSEILDEEARKHPASVASYMDVKDFESGAKFALGLVGEQGPDISQALDDCIRIVLLTKLNEEYEEHRMRADIMLREGDSQYVQELMNAQRILTKISDLTKSQE